MTSLNRFFTVFLSILVCLPAVLSADEDQYKLSEERIGIISGIIAKAVDNKEDLTNSAVIQSIYDKIAAEMPLAPEQPLVQVDLKELNAKAFAKAKKKFRTDPEKLKAKFAAEAEIRYPMAKLRDKVTVDYKRGSVTGTLSRITSSNILVNNTTVSFIDMDKETRSRFDSQFNEDLRTRYVQERLNEFKLEFTRYQQKIFEALLVKANGENEQKGYIFVKREMRWMTAKEIAAAKLAPEIKRYKKAKEKERRKREAKEKAEREAREKAEADARTTEQQPPDKTPDSTGDQPTATPPAQDPTTTPPPVTSADGKTAENFDPQDIFDSGNSSEATQTDDGGNFIALTPEELAKLSRPRVNEARYKDLMAEIDKKLEEINAKYFGIDADQGFKKALWGFSATDVFYALSKEPDALFIENSINIDYINYPKGSRPQRIFLHYYFGQLYRVETFLGDLKQNEFNIYKNSLQQKYGESDTQRKMGDDVFLRLAEGTLSPADLPAFVRINPDEGEEGSGEAGKPAPQGADQAAPPAPDANAQQGQASTTTNNRFYFVWEGKLSRGILSFRYDPETQMYKNVIFEKVYLPKRLKKLEEKQAAGSGKEAPKAE